MPDIEFNANRAARSHSLRMREAKDAMKRLHNARGTGPANRVPIQGSVAQPGKAPLIHEGPPPRQLQGGGRVPVTQGGTAVANRGGLPSTSRYEPDFGPRTEKDITPKGMQKWAAKNPKLAKMLPNLIRSGASSNMLKLLGVPAAIITTILAPTEMGDGSMEGVEPKAYDWGSADVDYVDPASQIPESAPTAPTPPQQQAPVSVAEEAAMIEQLYTQPTPQPPRELEPMTVTATAPESKGHWGLLDWGEGTLPQYQYD